MVRSSTVSWAQLRHDGQAVDRWPRARRLRCIQLRRAAAQERLQQLHGHRQERPLDAIELFIQKSAPGQVNEGFYRGDQALFVIVILTEEDDDANNSTTTPAATIAALDGFVMGEERYVIVTIAGPENSGCDSAFGSAAPSPILHQFTNSAAHGVFGDICQGDLAQALEDALDVIVDACDTLPPPVG